MIKISFNELSKLCLIFVSKYKRNFCCTVPDKYFSIHLCMHMYTNVYNTVPSCHKYMYQPCHNRITGTTNCTLEDGGIQCTSRFNFVLVRSKLES